MLSLARSLLPSIGRDDPWAALAGELGVDADTARSVTGFAVRADGSRELRPFQSVRVDDDLDAPAHPLRTALLDRAVMIFQPISLAADPAIATPIVRIAPGGVALARGRRRRTAADILDVPESKRFLEPLPVVLAIDRGTVNAGGPDERPRRALVVGSAAWLLSTVADLATSLGGDRRVLASPGNRELLLSATAWLAGLDELVATSGSGREVSRLAGLGRGVRITWSIVLLVVLPGAALAAGLAIGAWRPD